MEAAYSVSAGDGEQPTRNSPSSEPARQGAAGSHRAHPNHRRRISYILGSLIAVAVISLAILFLFDPARHAFYPVCALYRTTGLLCPGCGSLRAMHQLLHGNFAAALHFNLLLVCSLPLWVWFGARFCVLKLRNQSAMINIPPVWLWAGLVLIVAFGILRNLPFAQMAWLAP